MENLVEKARTEYGIVNAADMNEKQLKAEMKAIDDQDPANKVEKQNKKPNDKSKDKNKK